ncbi:MULTISPECIES: DUF6011 domain-containing protein [Methylosinus]|uniref:Uncharacterized protein n=1 Tax=Methylosinus trichosporium (strain ATCC 35070 / NCIMB 11131 / UNIQEM 75 / OB3b) TaxID=595536 RepID=A0A2D2CVT5_METT3|nr:MULTISPECIES: DUF6011 domain-containing protein [Methylosinus]ATQ66888.1 hypothetical protein CQW49_02490 [Methylosinus trichosporium OB3b]OBS54148.1 hypothetical protein A8B73_02650 [Methylosinus sp. 3S-1]
MASLFRTIRFDGETLRDLGVNDDGTLWNPNGYSADRVRAAVADAEETLRERRKVSAAKGAVTNKRRRDKRIHDIAKKIIGGANLSSTSCVCCGRALTDPETIERGIGPECWSHVLEAIEESRR